MGKEQLRNAIRVAQLGYEPGSKGADYYHSAVRPLLSQITEHGAWPDNAELEFYYEARQGEVTYEGLGVSLEILTPDQEFKGFSLPVLDLWYGRWV